MSLLANLLVSTLAILIADYFLTQVTVDGFWTAVLVALILGVINTFIKPIATILTLPITIITLGLFMFVLNALMVMLVDWLIPGFTIDGFLWALVFSLIVSFVSSILNNILKNS